jgi:hypothetical protein
MKLPLASVLLVFALPAAAAEKDFLAEADVRTLKDADVRADDEGLLAYLRGLKPGSEVRRQIKGLIASLGSDSFAEREEATRRLTALAVAARLDLEQATHSSDREVARRAKAILDEYDAAADDSDMVLLAVLREVARRHTPGAIPVLLDIPQLWERHDFRAAAEKAMTASARREDADALRQALGWRSAYVRLAAAVTLLNRGDRQALLTLGLLLDSTDLEIRNRAGRVLRAVTARDFGFVSYGSPDVRAKAAAAWRVWLQREGLTVSLTLPAPTETRLGKVLLCNPDLSRVVELDEVGKPVWQTRCPFPFCCEGQPNGHRLIGSYGGQVDEYDTEGKVVWSLTGQQPTVRSVRRLPNGNTLVADEGRETARLQEFQPDRRVCWEAFLPKDYLSDFQQLQDGHTLAAMYISGRIIELDRQRKVVWAIEGMTRPYSVQRLENGNTLVSEFERDCVVELDRSCKVVWSYKVRSPTHAQRLSNGHTLIASGHQKVFEIDAADQVLWEHTENGIIHLSAY